MKAIVIPSPGGPEVLTMQEIPDPRPGPEDLLVRVRATSLNRADLMQRRGGYPQPGPKPQYEVPGLEFAGEVIACGERTEGFTLGDRVMGLLSGGGYAEQVIVHYRQAMHVPEALSWTQAGAVPEVYITAHDALLQASLAVGESALIHAAGSGVGVAAIQIARVMGASLVLGTAGSEEKLDQARQIGLDIGINYRTQDFAAETLRATSGRGVDAVLDVIGAEYWDRNLRAMAPKGRMTIVGLMGGGSGQLNIGMLLGKRLQVRGTVLRARPLEEKALATRLFERSVLPSLANGTTKVVIDRVYPLAEVAEAHAYMETNANFGKIVLEVG